MAKQERKGRNGARHGRRRWTFGAGVAAAVVVALIVGWFAYRAQANLPGQKFADLGNLHVQTVGDPHEPYNSTPPTSGPHLPYIAPWGIHTRPIPNELQVHNLEDGVDAPRDAGRRRRGAHRAVHPSVPWDRPPHAVGW